MRVDISGFQFYFPQRCACCGGRPETTLVASAMQYVGKGKLRTTATRAWSIPYCRACVRHIVVWEIGRWVVLVVSALVGLAGLLALVAYGEPDLSYQVVGAGIAVLVSGIILLLARLGRLKKKSCSGIGRTVTYLGWQGSHHAFDIRSWSYAYHFMVMNERKLINLSPHTITMLKGSGLDQESAPQRAKRYRPTIRR